MKKRNYYFLEIINFFTKKNVTILQNPTQVVQISSQLYKNAHNYTQLYNNLQNSRNSTKLHKTLHNSTKIYTTQHIFTKNSTKILQNSTKENYTQLYKTFCKTLQPFTKLYKTLQNSTNLNKII